MANSLTDLTQRALDCATRNGFTDSSPGECIALMHSELSEALEELRNGREISDVYIDEKGKPCGVPSEIADVIIRALHFSGKYGIDIERAVLEKMAFNETRPFRHGKRF